MKLIEKGEQIKDHDKHMKLTERELEIQESEKHMRCLEWAFKCLISELQLPIYGKMEHFNYYDCFAAFVKYVFGESHRKDYIKRKEIIKNAKEAGTEDKLPIRDRIEDLDDPKLADFSPMDQEEWLEVYDKDF